MNNPAVCQQVFEFSPQPMLVFEPDSLEVVDVNEAAVRHYGYSRSEFLSLSLDDLRPPEDVPLLRRRFAEVQTQPSHHGVWRHCCRDGTLIHVEVATCELVFNGQPARLAMFYDVTFRRQFELSGRDPDGSTPAILDALALNVALLDGDGFIVASNQGWRDFAAARAGDPAVMGEGVNYLRAAERRVLRGDREPAAIAAGLSAVLGGDLKVFTREYCCRLDDGDHWYRIQVRPLLGIDVRRVVVVHEDVTERKRAERELHKLNRYYVALSTMNATIARVEEPRQVLDEVCRIAVEHGGLSLVWVGQLDADGRTVRRVAASGPAGGYLDEVDISADPWLVTGQGPVGRALREGRTRVVNDFRRDESMRPWHQAATHWKLGAVAVCPILLRNDIWGEIAFYAEEVDYFSDDLVELLEKLTADVAFSLDLLEVERERGRAEAELLLNASVLESSHEGIFITDADNKFTMVNRALCDITGYSREELLGNSPSMLASGRQDQAFYQNMWDRLAREDRWEGEIWDRRKNGEVFPVWLSITRVRNPQLRSEHYVAIYQDITDRKAYENRIEHLANHDPLTGLPNRVLLGDRIAMAMSSIDRNGGKLAVLFIDLDRFKRINDTLGHDIGDLLLEAVATRILGALRDSDTAARVGGDEFVVLLPEVDAAEGAARVAERIVRAVARPYDVKGHHLVVTASIGIAVYPDSPSQTPSGLAVAADIAMRSAKAAGNNRYHFYSDELGDDISDRLALENALLGAVERGEISLAYQPQCALSDGRVIGMEALARWNHPRYGPVSPAHFIPIAEDTGLILEMGAWIMREACRQARDWGERRMLDVPVSVNVSALQFRQANFLDTVKEVLADTGLPPSRLELELTESVLMSSEDQVLRKLNQLHGLGVRMAIDDFGTGYSSLAYLRQFPAQRLKIDKSFIADLLDDPGAASLARAIVSLANSLGIDTIAEGVETREQAGFLRGIWCEEAQGYFYARPMPPDVLEHWLSRDPAT